MEAEWPVVAG